METTLNTEQQKLWKLVQEINDCWYKGKPSELGNFFHNKVVFNSPDFTHQITGKENCVQTYIDFLHSSDVLLYMSDNPRVQLVDNTAIVTYVFELQYEQNDKIHHETGTDIMVFSKIQEDWKVIWRGISNLKNV